MPSSMRIAVCFSALFLSACNHQPEARLASYTVGARAAQATPTTTASSFDFDVRRGVEFLASDALEGRGVGTKGIDAAADFIAQSMGKLGLQPAPGLKDYFQPFVFTTAVAPGEKTALGAELGGQWTQYKVGEDYVPASFSDEGKFKGGVVFAGYGISSEEHKYDDYAGLDVKGKVVLAMRYEPHNEEGKSRFTKDDWSEEATLSRKANLAAEHGATALVLVNPPRHHPDELMSFVHMYRGDQAPIPVLHVKRAVADAWLGAADGKKDLKALQTRIDSSGTPLSFSLGNAARASGEVTIERLQRPVKNVVGVLPGRGDKADEYVVVGAHYDHLGKGESGWTLGPANRGQIHNGADDNASGVATMLELAEHYVEESERKTSPRRSILFVAFTAEESGLIGSQHFVNHCPVPLEKIAYMLNLDMVGRVQKQTLYVGGAGTAKGLDDVLKVADGRSPLKLKSIGRGGFGPSDHMSFALKRIPVVFFFSGAHQDYHRPTDDADKINYDGMRLVLALSTDVMDRLLSAPREKYVSTLDFSGAQHTGRTGSGVMLGIVPDYASEEESGVRLGGTTPGSPAATAGMKEGDVLVQFNDAKIKDLYDLTDQLRKSKPGEKVKLIVIRNKQRVELQTTLIARKSH